jgi:hypothetical protein
MMASVAIMNCDNDSLVDGTYGGSMITCLIGEYEKELAAMPWYNQASAAIACVACGGVSGAGKKILEKASAELVTKQAARRALKKALAEKAEKIAVCRLLYQGYKKACGIATNCNESNKSCEALIKAVAVSAACVRGRAKYLSMRCDYIDPIVITGKVGSAAAEKSHFGELKDRQQAMLRCIGWMTWRCFQDPPCPKK